MTDVVLFGTGRIADVVHDLLAEAEGDLRVVGFTVDREHLAGDEHLGLPAVPFDEVEERFPPDRHAMFVALGYQRMNGLRADRVAVAREKGYRLVSVVHPRADLPRGVELGENCLVMAPVAVQPRVRLGDDVFVWSGAVVGHHTTVGDHCWITSGASVAGVVTLGERCFLAIGATIANEVTLGARCFVGANALVTRRLDDDAVVIAPASEVQRLTSEQFLRMTRFR